MKSGFIVAVFLTFTSFIIARGYELTIVHNNDVHAHFEQVNVHSGECSEKQASADECYGGEARRVTFIKEARSCYQNTLVLDAGDRFAGTLWFNQYKGAAAATFVNMENYDAVCLGNHEFDLEVAGLVPYLDNLTVPILDANINVSGEPRLQGKFNKTLVKTVGGEQIGIIGYIAKDAEFLSNADSSVKFADELTTVREEVEKMKAAGIKIIIGLSHAGYGIDKAIAAQVDGIDVIVGGHSHTFLYTGEVPSSEKSEGPYPTIITQASGRTVLVVQAYAFGKYMGLLNVNFDEDGEVDCWTGAPVVLDKTIKQDRETLDLITEMKKPLDAIKQQIVGRTVVELEGDPIQCRRRECNLGNILTDSMIDYHIDKRRDNDTWALAAIALLPGGGIRASTKPGDISMAQVIAVQPFENAIDMIRIKGHHLREAFEHSVANYDKKDRPGAFFQMSGVKVVYDLSQPSHSRVVSLDVRCLHCTVPEFSPLDDNATYEVLLMNFIIKGRDGFSMIRDNIVERVALNSLDSEVFATYLRKYNPIYAGVEGRIRFVTTTSVVPSTVPLKSPTSPTTPTTVVPSTVPPISPTSLKLSPSVSITTSSTTVPVTFNRPNNDPNSFHIGIESILMCIMFLFILFFFPLYLWLL